MKPGLKIACVLVSLFALSMVALPPSKALEGNEHPIDVAKWKIRHSNLPKNVRDNLAELLNKVPRDLDKGQSIRIYERSGKTVVKNQVGNSWAVPDVTMPGNEGTVVRLEANRDEAEGPLAGWDFYWLKYLCVDNYLVRLPDQYIAIAVTNSGELDPPNEVAWLKGAPEGEFNIGVQENEAVSIALNLAKPNMKKIGIEKIEEIETFLTMKNGRPVWDVNISYSDVGRPRKAKYWDITGYTARIEAGDGEVVSHEPQMVYRPLPKEEGPERAKEGGGLPLAWIGIGIGVPAALVSGFIARTKSER